MTKEYISPELEVTELELHDVVLYSIPTESGPEMPILTRKTVTDELNGDPYLDPKDLLEEPTEF